MTWEQFDLGRHVWSLAHVRSAILGELDDGQLKRLLTLSSQSFPQVVEALYADLHKRKWTRYLFCSSTQRGYQCLKHRLSVYRRSVRSIDITGTLPACGAFSGGLAGLVAAFPRLRRVRSSCLTCEVHPSTISVTVRGAVEATGEVSLERHYASLPARMPTLAGRKSTWKYAMAVKTQQFELGLMLDVAEPELIGALVDLATAPDPIVHLAHSRALPELVGQVRSLRTYDCLDAGDASDLLTSLLTCPSASPCTLRSLYMAVSSDLPEFKYFMAPFTAHYLPFLTELELDVTVYLHDWPQATRLPIWWDPDPAVRSPPLRSLKLNLTLHAYEGINSVASYWLPKHHKHWQLNYLPPAETIATRVLALAGPAANCDVTVALTAANDDLYESYRNSTVIYTYLVRQEISPLTHGFKAPECRKPALLQALCH